VDGGVAARLATIPHGVLAVGMLAVGAVAPVFVPRMGYLSLGRALPPAAALFLTGLAVLWLLARRGLRPAVIATAAGTAAAYVLTAMLVFPALDRIKSAREFAETVRDETAESRAAGHPVVAFDVGNLPEAVAFYSDGVYMKELGDPAALAAHLGQEARVFAVASDAALDVASGFVVVDRRTLSGRRVALVANR